MNLYIHLQLMYIRVNSWWVGDDTNTDDRRQNISIGITNIAPSYFKTTIHPSAIIITIIHRSIQSSNQSSKKPTIYLSIHLPIPLITIIHCQWPTVLYNLWCGDDDSCRDVHDLREGQLDIPRAGRHVDEEVVQSTPITHEDELIEDLSSW